MGRKTRYEQETIILWNNDDDSCTIDTCDVRILHRLKELAEKYPELYEKVHGGYRWATYRCSKRLVSVRAPYSAERRQHDREIALAQNRVPPTQKRKNPLESEA